jgi:Protein of unknown function (DUF3105)
MAHRHEEKQRRREQRLAAERAAAATAARRRRVQWGGGAALAIALAAGIAVLALGTVGGSSSEGKSSVPQVQGGLPQQKTADLTAAANAAGCTLQHAAIEGRGHLTKRFTAADYRTNPPTSGAHYPVAYQDGVYASGDTPNLGMLVHTLEHGRIDVQYASGTPAATVAKLEALLAEQGNGYHMLLFQNTTGMKYQVAATAWGQLLGCPRMNDSVFDAIRTFRERYIDKGPEAVP